MIKNLYYKNKPNFLSIFIIILIAIFFIIDRYDVLFLLNPGYFFWHEQYGASIGQHLAGWYSFYYDDWYFPLTITKGVNHPNFNSIILSDSIPLLAVFFKILRNFLPLDFHYFGIWQILCILLLTHSSFILCSKKINSNIFICSLFSILCLSSYLLFSRSGNLTTNCHFLVYYGLFCYLDLKIGLNFKKIFYSLTLLIASLLIHFYFFSMVFALIFAGIFQAFRNHKYNLKNIIFLIFFYLSSILFIGYVFGFFYNLSGLNYPRFDQTGMPLLSLFFASKEFNVNTLFGNELNVMGSTDQYESLNYLGIGLIIMIIPSLKQINFRLIQNNIFIFIIFVLIFFYSLGGKIYFFDNLIFSYHYSNIPFLELVVGKLAVVGRMFIFNYIIITFFCFKFFFTNFNITKFIIGLFLVLLQFFDVYYLNFSEKKVIDNLNNIFNENKLTTYKQKDSDRFKNFSELLSTLESEIIYVIPPYNCKGSKEGSILYARIIRDQKKTNNIWFGRDNVTCKDKLNESINAFKNDEIIEFIILNDLLNEKRFDEISLNKKKYLNCIKVNYLNNISKCIKK